MASATDTKPRTRAANHSGYTYPYRNGYRSCICWQGVRYYGTGNSKHAALKAARVSMAKGKEQIAIKELGMTVGDWLTRWLEVDKRHELKFTTYTRYAGLIKNHISPALGEIALVNLASTHVNDFLRNMTQNNTVLARSAQHARSMLITSLQDAVYDGRLTNNVAKMSKPSRRIHKQQQTLTATEVRKVFDSTRNTVDYARVVLALFFGLRQGEALGLRWEDVDFEARTISINGQLQITEEGLQRSDVLKTPASYAVLDAPEIVLTALQNHLALQAAQREWAGDAWIESGYVFTNVNGGGVWHTNDRRRWLNILKHAEVNRIRLHDARHTATTLALESGATLEQVKQMMRHADISTTSNQYGKRTVVTIRQAHESYQTLLLRPVKEGELPTSEPAVA